MTKWNRFLDWLRITPADDLVAGSTTMKWVPCPICLNQMTWPVGPDHVDEPCIQCANKIAWRVNNEKKDHNINTPDKSMISNDKEAGSDAN